MSRRQGRPVWLPKGGEALVLERFDAASYTEEWLQRLVHDHPSVLPLWEIEPACSPAFAVCMELKLGESRSADNLLISPDGNLTLVECKLWRNPEARRSVIAQILEYAKDLSRLDYADLEERILRAVRPAGTSLYAISQSTLAEAEFVDAVSRNLRRGRFLLVIAGDGITESAESLVEHLQQHAGTHFTLALVQLSIFEVANGDIVVVPSVPLRTTNVIRGIVEVRDGIPHVEPVGEADRGPRTLSESEFFEALDRLLPGTTDRIRALISAGADLGLYHEMKKTLIVRLPIGAAGEVNVLIIYPNGHIDTSTAWFQREALGEEVLLQLQREMAAAIPGAIVTPAARQPAVAMKDGPLTIQHILNHADAWLQAVRRFHAAVLERQSAEP